MLYVKNLVFLDGAIAALAPDLDLIKEITQLSVKFTEKHANQLASELGDVGKIEVDINGIKSSMGLDNEVSGITYKELQARRELITRRMQSVKKK
jgi:ubiquinone biosynthesis protein